MQTWFRPYRCSGHLGLLQELCVEDQLRGIYIHGRSDWNQRWKRQMLVSLQSRLSMEGTNINDHSNRYRDTQGTLYYNGSSSNGLPVYAAAYMIQSSPSMICPYYNGTASYRSSTGLAYYIVCGGQYTNGIDINSVNTPSAHPIFRCLELNADLPQVSPHV